MEDEEIDDVRFLSDDVDGDEETLESASPAKRTFTDKNAFSEQKDQEDDNDTQQSSNAHHQEDQGSFIDVSNANRRVWLVKLPHFIAERLDQLASGEDVLLGTVRSQPQGPKGASISNQLKLMIKLDEHGFMTGLPLDYHLTCHRPSQPIHMLTSIRTSEDNDTGDQETEFVGIQGKVEQECVMQPLLEDARYRALLRTRTEQANRPARTTQLLDANGGDISSPSGVTSPSSLGLRHLGNLRHVSEHQLLREQAARLHRNRQPGEDIRRERLPRNEVMEMLFRSFERVGRMSFAELVKQTQQPAQYLKDILQDIAIYNKRGPFKNLWELKPEYAEEN